MPDFFWGGGLGFPHRVQAWQHVRQYVKYAHRVSSCVRHGEAYKGVKEGPFQFSVVRKEGVIYVHIQ